MNYYDQDLRTRVIAKLGEKDISNLITSYSQNIQGANKEHFRIGEAPSMQVDIELNTLSLTDEDFKATLHVAFESSDDNWQTKEVKDIGYFYLIDGKEDYQRNTKLTYYDAMSKGNVPYNSNLDYESGNVTTRQQMQEICEILGIGYQEFGIKDIPVSWWDNTVTIRTYISWIAEISGCNAIVNRDNYIEFIPLGTASNYEIDLSYMFEYEVSEEFECTRILFNDGLQEFVKGDETGNTIYLNSKNGYIDNQSIIDDLYAQIKGLRAKNVQKIRGFGNLDLFFGTLTPIKDNKETIGYALITGIKINFGGALQGEYTGLMQTKEYEQVANYIGDTSIKRITVDVDSNTQKLSIESKRITDSENKISSLELDYNGFKTEVSETYVTEEGLEDAKQTIINQTSNDITFSFNQAKEYADGQNEAYREEVSKFIRFVEGRIEIGEVGNEFSMVLTNERLSFFEHGTEVAYFSNQQLYITNAHIEKNLYMGNFAFIIEPNGSVSLKKV